jgi:hypothetical protein
VHRLPFLHFHVLKDGQRYGDIKGPDGWFRLVLPEPLSPSRQRTFLRALRVRYATWRPGSPRSSGHPRG